MIKLYIVCLLKKQEITEKMSSEEPDFEQELFELIHNLSSGLAVPLPQDLLDLNFVISCLNSLMPHFVEDWEQIEPVKVKSQDIEEWRQVLSIVQSSFLDEDQVLIHEDEEITLNHILQMLQILCQVLEKIRQQNLKPMNMSSQNVRQSAKNEKKQKKQQSSKEKVDKNHRNKKKSVEKEKKEKNKPIQRQSKKCERKKEEKKIERGSTKKIIPEMKKVQEEVVERVIKTINQYQKKRNDPNRQARIKDKQGTQAVGKAKRTLDYAVKQFQKENRRNNNAKNEEKKNKPSTTNVSYLKMIAHKHKALSSEIQGQQLKYYLEMRDKKIAYIQHVHKLIEKLEKQRQIDQAKKEREMQSKKKKQICMKIENVDNLFKHNMEQLKENYEKKKEIKSLQQVNEMNVCRNIEKSVRKQKEKEMQTMKDVWEAECRKLQLITGNEEKLKDKLYEIYRKNRV